MRSLRAEFELYDMVHELKHWLELSDGIDSSRFIRHMLFKDESNQVKLFVYKEGNHARPHFHVYYKNDYSASICIDTGEVLAGNMPKKYMKPIVRWQEKNSAYLKEQWVAIQNGAEPIKFTT